MNLQEQKSTVRCSIQRVLRGGVRDEQADRARAIRQIRESIVAAGIPVFSTHIVFLPNYNGYGPMWYGETLVLLDGEPQHFELMTEAS